MRTGVVGLGDMGSGLAKNLIASGFPTTGFDLSPGRMTAFATIGGGAAASASAVGENTDAVFVMVMNGDQAKAVILGEAEGQSGLVHTLKPGSVVILTATVRAAEARAIGDGLQGSGIDFIDCPVSGGFSGAQTGALTLMAAAPSTVIERWKPVLEAIGKTIHHVGETPGAGQTVKACLQTIIGSMFTATFEASVLAAKAGVSGQVLYDVVSSSGAGCGITRTSLENIIDRRFTGTGSHIRTMYKDLTIALDLGRDLGVPLFTAATAMQLFQAGKTRHPEGDNWIVTRVLEDVVDAALAREPKS